LVEKITGKEKETEVERNGSGEKLDKRNRSKEKWECKKMEWGREKNRSGAKQKWEMDTSQQ